MENENENNVENDAIIARLLSMGIDVTTNEEEDNQEVMMQRLQRLMMAEMMLSNLTRIITIANNDDDDEQMMSTFMENVPVKLPDETRNTIGITKYGSDDNEKYSSCSICLENFKQEENMRRLLCTHIFHPACIDSWFDQSPCCPVCKQDQRDLLK